jgi:hypothetical protein
MATNAAGDALAGRSMSNAAGRALACERMLALEGVYPALQADLPELVEYFTDDGVEVALAGAVGEQMFRYWPAT